MNKATEGITMRGRQIGFCYLVSVSGHQKIGRSTNVDGVLANARRFDASARLISCWPTEDCVQVERIIHDGLARYRVENEQFNLTTDTLQWIASLCDREFGAWVTETGCDERATGWEFPRVFIAGARKRLWPCLFFPETDTAAWAMVASDTKPDYATVERLYLQDSRTFNSVWLGRPQKFGGARVGRAEEEADQNVVEAALRSIRGMSGIPENIRAHIDAAINGYHHEAVESNEASK